MFVTVMLAAGSLALERSENTFQRLVRRPGHAARGLLAEKIAARGRAARSRSRS